MSEPERRVMDEQEPSGSVTLHWRGDRSHGPTEWRLSPWTLRRTRVQLVLWKLFNFVRIWAATEVHPGASHLGLAGSGHLKAGA